MQFNQKLLTALLFFALFVISCKKSKETEEQINLEVETDHYLKRYEDGNRILKSYDFDGLNKYLTRQNDTTYVINFWATWCVPCVEELPHFEKVNQEYANKKFKMLLISLDFPKMVESRVLPFIRNNQLQAEVIHLNDPDANRWIELVDPSWSGAIPATLIYRNQKRAFYEQSFDEASLKNEIEQFIN